MEWTTETPTKPDWYWVKKEGMDALVIAPFVTDKERGPCFSLWGVHCPLNSFSEWAGPIPKPNEVDKRDTD